MPGQIMSRGLTRSVRGIVAIGFAHTYTRTPVAPPTGKDVFARESGTPGTPVGGQRCRYLQRTHLERTPGGRIVATSPPAIGTRRMIDTLGLPWDDPLKVGDTVSDIRDRAGRVLLAGPVPVEAIEDVANFGEPTGRIAVLRGTPVERDG
jgi:hypothetical protein